MLQSRPRGHRAAVGPALTWYRRFRQLTAKTDSRLSSASPWQAAGLLALSGQIFESMTAVAHVPAKASRPL
jgi:hypothetical protein